MHNTLSACMLIPPLVISHNCVCLISSFSPVKDSDLPRLIATSIFQRATTTPIEERIKKTRLSLGGEEVSLPQTETNRHTPDRSEVDPRLTGEREGDHPSGNVSALPLMVNEDWSRWSEACAAAVCSLEDGITVGITSGWKHHMLYVRRRIYQQIVNLLHFHNSDYWTAYKSHLSAFRDKWMTSAHVKRAVVV